MKLITQIIISALLMIFTTGYASANPKEYLMISSTEVEVKGSGEKKFLDLEIKTASPIPVDGRSGAFGYAALSDGGNNLLVIVTHLPTDDSSHENPDSGFHTHVLDLKKPTVACPGANFEVDVANSKKNNAFDADYQWKVKGNKIEVEKVPIADLGDAGVESVVSFTLKPVLDNNKQATNLCITVIDQK